MFHLVTRNATYNRQISLLAGTKSARLLRPMNPVASEILYCADTEQFFAVSLLFSFVCDNYDNNTINYNDWAKIAHVHCIFTIFGQVVISKAHYYNCQQKMT